MSKAFPSSHQKESIASQFREWAGKKGVDYFKKGNLEGHCMVFEVETGLRIQPCVAHDLIGRLVRQRNRSKRKEDEVGVEFFRLRPSLIGHFC